MHPFVRRIIDWQGYRAACEDIRALDDVIGQLHWGKDRTPREAHAAIEGGLLSLCTQDAQGEMYSSQGFFITKNGYALTAWHCIENKTRIVGKNKRLQYDFKHTCVKNRELDIALIKARIRGPGEAVPYVYHHPARLRPNDPLLLRCRFEDIVEGEPCILTRDIGTAMTHKRGSPQRFMHTGPAIRGDSGGILCTPEGSIYGIQTHGVPDSLDRVGTKIGACLHLVATYRAHLARKYRV